MKSLNMRRIQPIEHNLLSLDLSGTGNLTGSVACRVGANVGRMVCAEHELHMLRKAHRDKTSCMRTIAGLLEKIAGGRGYAPSRHT